MAILQAVLMLEVDVNYLFWPKASLPIQILKPSDSIIRDEADHDILIAVTI